MESAPSPARRSFLQRFLTSWLSLIVLPAIYAVVRYAAPPRRQETLLESVTVGKASEIPALGVTRVKFNRKPVYILRNAEGQIRALSGVCTHLGCVVEFIPAESTFHCNCHSSVFALDGRNLSGPAPRPLEAFRVEMKGDDIAISIIQS